jgi:hypothetical protein
VDEPIQQGVADVLRLYHGQMPPEVVRARLAHGLAHPGLNVRKGFYEAAATIEGPSAWERAQQDPAQSIRKWAAAQAARR